MRIYPAWWLALAVVGLGMHRIRVHTATNLVLYATLLIGFRPKVFVLNGLLQAWTLTVELCFYAFLPLFALAVHRRRVPVAVRARRQLFAVGLLVVFGVVCRAATSLRAPGHPLLIALPTQIDVFALGMGLAVVRARLEVTGTAGPATAWVGRHPALCWSAAGVAFWVLATLVGLPRQTTLEPFTIGQEMGRHVLFGVVALLLLLPAVFGPPRAGRIRTVLASRPMYALGLISYGIYLWHLDLMRRFIEPAFGRDASGGGTFVAVMVGGALASAAVATLSYVVVERPLMRRSSAARRSALPSTAVL